MKIPADLQDSLLSLLLHPILPILLIIVLAMIVIRLSHGLVRGLVKTLLDREVAEGTAQELSAVEIQKRMDTLDALGAAVIRGFILVIALVMILDQLSLNIGPAIAGLGILGIAVGFGAQSLVKDYFNGALILIENQFSVGDVVSIAGVSGSVEDFSLRRTTLRDLSGTVHTVPNGEIQVASNRTRVWARINEAVEVAYGSDMDHVIATVNAVGQGMYDDPEWRRQLLEPPAVLRVQALGESGVTVKVLGSVRAAEQWAVAGEFRRRVLAAFEANGIEIPFPHRVVISRPAMPDPTPVAPPVAPAEDAPAEDASADAG
jgi:small conductance mechanosensitive channel